MNRSRVALAAAVLAVAALAGCSGGDASQSDVQDDVADFLNEGGYGEHTDLSAAEVGAASTCIAQTLFDPDEFSKEERNEVASSVDSEPPPAGLVDKFVLLVEDCVTAAVDEEEQTSDGDEEQGPTAGDDDNADNADEDGESTTTTD